MENSGAISLRIVEMLLLSIETSQYLQVHCRPTHLLGLVVKTQSFEQ